MTTGHPPFSPGDKEVSATFLNRVGDAADAVLGPRHGPLTIAGDADRSRFNVLVIKKAAEGQRTMRVQRVKYDPGIPKPCTGEETCFYGLVGAPFDAYPDLGAEPSDYDDFEWDKKGPDKTSKVLKCYWEDGYRFVEKPAAASAEIDYCVILQTSGAGNPVNVSPPSDSTLGAFKLRVQRVHLNDDGIYEAKGKPIVATTRPNCPGTFYDDYRRSNRNGTFTGSPTSETWTWSAHANMITFLVVKSDGVWVVEQPPPLVIRTFPAGTAAGCTTV